MEEESIGARVKQRRLARGMSQRDLAKAVGTSHAYINLIEHGARHPGRKAVDRLATALGVTPVYLAHGEEPVRELAVRVWNQLVSLLRGEEPPERIESGSWEGREAINLLLVACERAADSLSPLGSDDLEGWRGAWRADLDRVLREGYQLDAEQIAAVKRFAAALQAEQRLARLEDTSSK